MVKRKHWLRRIELLWRERSVLWLSGVRRAGKTVLSQTLPHVDYYDCELPRIRGLMADPEKFLKERKGKRIVLDEIHRLDNPSELLKIAADHYPKTKILATGSSSLSASTKFKDTLAGRKAELWLTPLISDDLKDFGRYDIKHRFLFGGLPPFFLSKKLPEKYFQEWIDAYWAKDIQELFRLERRNSFQKFFELLMIQSGGIFEASRFSNQCAVSHTTISNYLRVLEETYVVHVLRPFSTYRSTEIVAAPKVYMFDTGFVCYYRGLHDLKSTEFGQMWEHYVLNELQSQMQSRNIRYWRDKQGHEVDFIIERRGEAPIAIEAKWSSNAFDFAGLKIFLHQYPNAKAFFVSNDLSQPKTKNINGIPVIHTGLKGLIHYISQDI
ncbi:MAG: ATP-binding protein [Elusimicrobia bacterium]|nr:ATP-binding protein [Elusimicrobiota bacterium]